MNWFIARIVFRIISGEGNHNPQFDEQLKLIAARDEEEAYEKAFCMGKDGEDSFPNATGKKVEWKFVGVAELSTIPQLDDGAELYSKIIETDNADNYTYYIQQKNYDIKSGLISLKTNTFVI